MGSGSKLKMFAGKVIAIDGPAGSGKSTVARRLARFLGFEYLDTGAMYRAVAWISLQESLDLRQEGDLRRLLAGWDVRLDTEGDTTRVFQGDLEITEQIRSEEITERASEIACLRKVREFLVIWQRRKIAGGGVVLEGRDTTTVVAPSADVKIYLDAKLQTRAARRLLEYALAGIESTLEEQTAKLAERDARDQQRANGPLRRAPDAVVVDTTDFNIEQVTDHVLRLCKNRLKGASVPGGAR